MTPSRRLRLGAGATRRQQAAGSVADKKMPAACFTSQAVDKTREEDLPEGLFMVINPIFKTFVGESGEDHGAASFYARKISTIRTPVCKFPV